jgi:hypothetical protein
MFQGVLLGRPDFFRVARTDRNAFKSSSVTAMNVTSLFGSDIHTLLRASAIHFIQRESSLKAALLP